MRNYCGTTELHFSIHGPGISKDSDMLLTKFVMTRNVLSEFLDLCIPAATKLTCHQGLKGIGRDEGMKNLPRQFRILVQDSETHDQIKGLVEQFNVYQEYY